MDRFLDLILAALGLIYGQRWAAPFVPALREGRSPPSGCGAQRTKSIRS